MTFQIYLLMNKNGWYKIISYVKCIQKWMKLNDTKWYQILNLSVNEQNWKKQNDVIFKMFPLMNEIERYKMISNSKFCSLKKLFLHPSFNFSLYITAFLFTYSYFHLSMSLFLSLPLCFPLSTSICLSISLSISLYDHDFILK